MTPVIPKAQLFNAYISVVQRLLASGLFTREDTSNVPRLSKLYFLYIIL